LGIELSSPVIWLIIVIILGAIEAVTVGLTTIWFAAGALIAMIAAIFRVPLIGQILLFLISSSVLLYYTRPIVMKYLKIGKTKTNINSYIGEKGIVLKKISPLSTGQVKVRGQVWTAKSFNDEEIQEKERIVVVSVEGVKLVVKKEE